MAFVRTYHAFDDKKFNKLDKSAGRGILEGELIQAGPHMHLLNMDFTSAMGLGCEPGLCIWAWTVGQCSEQ